MTYPTYLQPILLGLCTTSMLQRQESQWASEKCVLQNTAWPIHTVHRQKTSLPVTGIFFSSPHFLEWTHCSHGGKHWKEAILLDTLKLWPFQCCKTLQKNRRLDLTLQPNLGVLWDKLSCQVQGNWQNVSIKHYLSQLCKAKGIIIGL